MYYLCAFYFLYSGPQLFMSFVYNIQFLLALMCDWTRLGKCKLWYCKNRGLKQSLKNPSVYLFSFVLFFWSWPLLMAVNWISFECDSQILCVPICVYTGCRLSSYTQERLPMTSQITVTVARFHWERLVYAHLLSLSWRNPFTYMLC